MVYDAFGRRIAKTSKIETLNKLNQQGKLVKYPTTLLHLRKTDKTTYQSTLMLWEGNRQIQEYTNDFVFTTVYDDQSFEPVARVVQVRNSIESDNIQETFKVYHYHNNHLGTPQELTDDDGNVIWANYEWAWGGRYTHYYTTQSLNDCAILEHDLQPIRFQGQFFDPETSLHYNRFRYYDSDVGMFISRDPIGLLGGNNVFQYAPNPVGWIDPWGLISIHKLIQQQAEKLRSQGIGGATKVTVVRDKVTGKTYTGVSGNPNKKISKDLKRYLSNKSREPWKVKNCSEVDAFNKAFKARPGANMKDMKSVIIFVEREKNAQLCKNCQILTRNASVENIKCGD